MSSDAKKKVGKAARASGTTWLAASLAVIALLFCFSRLNVRPHIRGLMGPRVVVLAMCQLPNAGPLQSLRKLEGPGVSVVMPLLNSSAPTEGATDSLSTFSVVLHPDLRQRPPMAAISAHVAAYAHATIYFDFMVVSTSHRLYYNATLLQQAAAQLDPNLPVLWSAAGGHAEDLLIMSRGLTGMLAAAPSAALSEARSLWKTVERVAEKQGVELVVRRDARILPSGGCKENAMVALLPTWEADKDAQQEHMWACATRCQCDRLTAVPALPAIGLTPQEAEAADLRATESRLSAELHAAHASLLSARGQLQQAQEARDLVQKEYEATRLQRDNARVEASVAKDAKSRLTQEATAAQRVRDNAIGAAASVKEEAKAAAAARAHAVVERKAAEAALREVRRATAQAKEERDRALADAHRADQAVEAAKLELRRAEAARDKAQAELRSTQAARDRVLSETRATRTAAAEHKAEEATSDEERARAADAEQAHGGAAGADFQLDGQQEGVEVAPPRTADMGAGMDEFASVDLDTNGAAGGSSSTDDAGGGEDCVSYLRRNTLDLVLPCNQERKQEFERKYPSDVQTNQQFFERAERVLRELVGVMDAMDIPFMIAAGTLLSWARQCSLGYKPDDFDVAVMLEDMPTNDLLAALEARGFQRFRVFGAHMRYGNELAVKKEGVQVDIFTNVEREKDIMHTAWDGARCKMHQDRHCTGGHVFAFSFPKLKFAWAELLPGVKVRVPYPVEEWLQAKYGPEWIDKNQGSWHWIYSTKNYAKLMSYEASLVTPVPLICKPAGEP